MNTKKIYNYNCLTILFLVVTSCGLMKTSLNYQEISRTETQMNEFIKILQKDSELHENIGAKLTNSEIQGIEQELQLSLPPSYKFFLRNFGNGAYWLYNNPIDDIRQSNFIKKYHNDLGERIELDDEKEYNTNSLLCLMTEDSNCGSWVWLTSENTSNNEWPLAYFNIKDRKLHYKVDNFLTWIKILIDHKTEVIRVLDKEGKLNLG